MYDIKYNLTLRLESANTDFIHEALWACLNTSKGEDILEGEINNINVLDSSEEDLKDLSLVVKELGHIPCTKAEFEVVFDIADVNKDILNSRQENKDRGVLHSNRFCKDIIVLREPKGFYRLEQYGNSKLEDLVPELIPLFDDSRPWFIPYKVEQNGLVKVTSSNQLPKSTVYRNVYHNLLVDRPLFL